MNTSLLTRILSVGSVAALTIGLGGSALAGPSPGFWQQRALNAKARAEAAKAVEAVTVAPAADAKAMACPACRTEKVREFSSGLPNGKGTPRWTDVGIKHTCEHCDGAITVVRSTAGRTANTVRTANSMKQGCSMCGVDAALCVAAVKASISR